MKTSNFANHSRQHFDGAISISRWPGRHVRADVECPLLFPSAELLAFYKAHPTRWDLYVPSYNAQLDCLNPQRTWDYLHDLVHPYEPILLCVESSKTEVIQCHRRLVAEWFEQELGVEVPEWGREDA